MQTEINYDYIISYLCNKTQKINPEFLNDFDINDVKLDSLSYYYFNNSCSFDSILNSLIYILNTDDFYFDENKKLSISAWIKLSQDNYFNLTKPKIITERLKRELEELNGFTFALLNENIVLKVGNDVYLRSDRKIQDEHWHHVAFTHDGFSSKIYIDGEETADSITQQSIGIGGNKDLLLGGRNNVENRFPGFIDRVTIWNYVLTQKEINTESSRQVNFRVSSK